MRNQVQTSEGANIDIDNVSTQSLHGSTHTKPNNGLDPPKKFTTGPKASAIENIPRNPFRSNIIDSTVHKLLHLQEDNRQKKHQQQHKEQSTSEIPDNAGTFQSHSPSIGLFGERNSEPITDSLQFEPLPGTKLVYPASHFLHPSSKSFQTLKQKYKNSIENNFTSAYNVWSPSPIRDAVTVRAATRLDDTRIANLRLSVFANYNNLPSATTTTTPSSSRSDSNTATNDQIKNLRSKFRIRSCQVLETRRNLGATCLIASVPKVFQKEFKAYSKTKQQGYGVQINQSSNYHYHQMMEYWQQLPNCERSEEWIMGSVECSFHEFYGTDLGKERLKHSILYITEVAVNPDARKIGVGRKLLEGVDNLAQIRNIETLFLHVDVTNEAALRLYTTAGYKKVEQNQKYHDFTEALNLHDGAANGRKHFLLYKHLRVPTILAQNDNQKQKKDGRTENSWDLEIKF